MLPPNAGQPPMGGPPPAAAPAPGIGGPPGAGGGAPSPQGTGAEEIIMKAAEQMKAGAISPQQFQQLLTKLGIPPEIQAQIMQKLGLGTAASSGGAPGVAPAAPGGAPGAMPPKPAAPGAPGGSDEEPDLGAK